jgi:hypothetical protein
MTGPGEVMSQRSAKAQEYLSKLSEAELLNYRKLIKGIVDNPKFAYVDEMITGLTPNGKLQVIDSILDEMR